VEVVNPDHHIATLNAEGTLNMTMRVTRGRGFVPVKALAEDEGQETGLLRLDATYSPIKRVTYQVDNARVEQRTNLDRLSVDIDTDGTLEAEEILRISATILQHQLSAFAELGRLEEVIEEKEESEPKVNVQTWRPANFTSPCQTENDRILKVRSERATLNASK